MGSSVENWSVERVVFDALGIHPARSNSDLSDIIYGMREFRRLVLESLDLPNSASADEAIARISALDRGKDFDKICQSFGLTENLGERSIESAYEMKAAADAARHALEKLYGDTPSSYGVVAEKLCQRVDKGNADLSELMEESESHRKEVKRMCEDLAVAVDLPCDTPWDGLVNTVSMLIRQKKHDAEAICEANEEAAASKERYADAEREIESLMRQLRLALESVKALSEVALTS